MKNSKLIALLSTFDSKQLRALTDFVQSPYFNKKEELVTLYAYLKKLAKQDFPEKRLRKETVFAKVFPKEPFDDKKLHHCISWLFLLVERFLAIHALEQDQSQAAIYTLEYYLANDLEKQYEYTCRKAHKTIENFEKKNEKYYFYKSALADIADRNFMRSMVRRYDENIQLAADHLDRYYLLRKLKYLCSMLDRRKAFHWQYELRFVEEILNTLGKGWFDKDPNISIYYLLIRFLTDEENAGKFFNKFKSQILANGDPFTIRELEDLYYFGINFCLRRIRFGEKDYAYDLLELYQRGVESRILLKDGVMSHLTFKNIVKLGLGLNKLKWTETFIQQNYKSLPTHYQTDALHYNLAELHYYQGDYDQALLFLNRTKFSDIHYNLHSKVMLAKIYYENREEYALESLIASFAIYLKRKSQITKDVRLPYQNFLNLMKDLMRSKSRQERASLLKRLEKTKLLTGRNWLIKQISQDIQEV